MAKKTKAEMSAMGITTTSLAQEYRKKHPNASWTKVCMVEAGKEYRRIKGSGPKKKKKVKKTKK